MIIGDDHIRRSGIEVCSFQKYDEESEKDEYIENGKNSKYSNDRSENPTSRSDETSNDGDDCEGNTGSLHDPEVVSFSGHPEFIRRYPFVEVESTFIDGFLDLLWIIDRWTRCLRGGKCTSEHIVEFK